MGEERVLGDPRKLIEEALKDVEKEFKLKLEDLSEGAMRILESARIELVQEAEKRVSEILSRVTDRLKAEEAALQAQMRLKVAEERSKWIDKAIELAKERFDEYAKTDEYRELLRRMIESAVRQIDAAEIIVEANERDAKLVKELLKEIDTGGKKVKLSDKPVDILGGIKAETPDGSIRLDLSLDIVFNRIAQDYRAIIARSLFGGEE